jgi:hypothetical protein
MYSWQGLPCHGSHQQQRDEGGSLTDAKMWGVLAQSGTASKLRCARELCRLSVSSVAAVWDWVGLWRMGRRRGT